MERTMTTRGSEDIQLYVRTYDSLLRTTDEVQIQTLVETHAGMDSLLHVGSREDALDVPALVYCSLRLPSCVTRTRLVVMGQSERVFARHGYVDVEAWQPVIARGRRRRSFYDGQETLAVYVASRSDIDDLLPMLTAFQIEWNKAHLRLRSSPILMDLEQALSVGRSIDADLSARLCDVLCVSEEDMERLHAIWRGQFLTLLVEMGRHRRRMSVRLLAGSQVEYRKATQRWWENIAAQVSFDLGERPVYFVSSNTHSLVNMLSGFALRREGELARYVRESGDPDLEAEYVDIKAQQVPSSHENFMYYALKKCLQDSRGLALEEEREREERQCGIRRVGSTHVFDVAAQVVELSALRIDWLDRRLRLPGIERVAASESVILNIDYPLGMGAYHILSQVAASVGSFRGVYVLGKAATLNGRIGDVVIPNVVFDEHSGNRFLFGNAFSAAEVHPHLVYGSVLDNQKAISVRGTFLQNRLHMDEFYRAGYTDIEMEAGPYLSAVYEALRPNRYPTDELVDLYPVPFDVGIIHYASDTPFSKGKNLGAQHLSYFGMDSTYAATVAILRRILTLEIEQVSGGGVDPSWTDARRTGQ